MTREKKNGNEKDLKTEVTKKQQSENSWSGEIKKDQYSRRVDVHSITGLLKRCAEVSDLQ